MKNDAARARQAIMSIRRFAPANTEIVLIDNESDDGLADEVGVLVDVYLRAAGKVGDCRRRGVVAANGDMLLFMDADQELGPDTLNSAVARLRDCEAVVIPERPRDESRFLHKVIRAERVWVEWLGLGVPRLFNRLAYDSTGGYVAGASFGEDRFASSKVVHVELSTVPIYHDEVADLPLLLKKYRAYGRASAGESGFSTLLDKVLHFPRRRGDSPAVGDFLLLPFVVALKLAKATALLGGRAFHSRHNQRPDNNG